MKATNAAIMKEKNKKLVLDLIRDQRMSRAELSQQTGLTKPALSAIVEELLKEHVIKEAKEITNEVGRRPLKLYLNREYIYFAGVNITRYHYEVGIMDFYGEILTQSREDILPGCSAQSVIKRICSMITQALLTLDIPEEKLYGIGVTTPGPVDTKTATVLTAPNFNRWHFVNISEQIKQVFSVPVYLENVANAWAVCEKYFGIAKHVSNFMVVKIDEGIGSGIMLDGKLHTGLNELGHTTIKYDGIRCPCGNKGCLERYASIGAILKGTPYRTWKEAVDANDTDVIKKEASYLIPALVNACNLFSLDVVVLASDIAYKSKMLLELLNSQVSAQSLSSRVHIVRTNLSSSVQSAAVVAFDYFFHI